MCFYVQSCNQITSRSQLHPFDASIADILTILVIVLTSESDLCKPQINALFVVTLIYCREHDAVDVPSGESCFLSAAGLYVKNVEHSQTEITNTVLSLFGVTSIFSNKHFFRNVSVWIHGYSALHLSLSLFVLPWTVGVVLTTRNAFGS